MKHHKHPTLDLSPAERRKLPRYTVCLGCKQPLKPHERPEGWCDQCLRAHTTA